MEQQFMIWVASLGGKSNALDAIVMLIIGCDFLKGVPFAMSILLAWSVPFEKDDRSHRIYALRMLLVVTLSVIAARLAQGLVFSPRPIMVPEIADHFSSFAKNFQVDWNSFPSDHLCLYFPIGLMTYLKNRKLGIALILWSVIGIGLPRIYVGRHYPSDVLGGMALGSAIFALIWSQKARIDPFLQKISAISETHPKTVFSLLYLYCFQIATVFDSTRWIISTAKNVFIHRVIK